MAASKCWSDKVGGSDSKIEFWNLVLALRIQSNRTGHRRYITLLQPRSEATGDKWRRSGMCRNFSHRQKKKLRGYFYLSSSFSV